MTIGTVIQRWAAPAAVVGLLAAAAPQLRAQSPPSQERGRWSKVSVQLPTSVTLFPAGEGADIANTQCLICHSAGMVLLQPALTQSQWQATLNKMRTAYGAPLPAEQVDALAAYLSRLTADGAVADVTRGSLAGTSGASDQRTVASILEKPATTASAGEGPEIFVAHCAACHQTGGIGIPGAFPPLASSNWVNGGGATTVQIVLHGVQGTLTVNGIAYNGAMPEFGSQLSDAQIAAVLSYVRSAWGNKAAPVPAALVGTQRAATAARSAPWNGDADLAKMN
jgi:mono/diheme cytochrome c family protein